MKKLVLFISILFVALSFNSCNDDDDEGVVITDKIIGKWQFDQVFEDGDEITLTACDKQSTWEFSQAGTFTIRDFWEENDVCTAQEPVTGTWENLGNSMYELDDFLEIEPGISIDVEVKITFTNNKMTIEYSFTDEDDIAYELKAIYIKI